MVQFGRSIDQYIFTALKLEDLPENLLNRTILLQQNKAARTKIVLMKYEQDYYEKLALLDGKWGGNFKNNFINMYEFLRSYCGKATPEREKKSGLSSGIEEENSEVMDDKRSNNFEDEILKNNPIKINEYDELGHVIRTKVIERSIVKYEYFYDVSGYCFLFKENELDSEQKIRTTQIKLFDQNDKGILEFEDEECLWHYFLDTLVDEKNTLITADNIEQYYLIQNYNNKDVYKAYFINNFDESYGENGSNILGMEWGNCPAMLNIPDAIVFSTKTQLNDVVAYYGKRNNLFHLPIFSDEKVTGDFSNIIPQANNIVLTLDDNDVVELELIVRASRIVVDKMRDAIITIYGINTIKDSISELIKALSLEENVIINKSAKEMNQIYKVFTGAVFIKRSESNNLEMIRSLKNGCPVITNDFNYETKEIITNRENGYIVKKDSVSSLSKGILQLLESRDQISMREKARLSVEQFNSDVFLECWDFLINSITTNWENKIFVEDMKVHLEEFQWVKQKKVLIKSIIELSGEANEQTKPSIYLRLVNRKTTKYIQIDGEVNKINYLRYEFSGDIDFPLLDLSQNIWDLIICLEWDNAFFEKRVGHFRSDIKLKPNVINNRIVTPYFTKIGKNLSFKVGKYITNKDKIIEIEKELGLL